jgi:uncharacterized membrane protein YdjX (TVP38/TMEM64 family)
VKNILLPTLISVFIISIVFILFGNIEEYFDALLNNSRKDIETYIGVSFLVLSSDIILPVPSSIVMYMNGLVLGTSFGFLLSLVSALISALIGYYLGRWTNFGFNNQLKATQLIQKYGSVAIILTRGIPIISESICYTAGYNKMSFRLYILLNFIGYIPVCLVYAFFGQLGSDKNLFLLSFSLALIVSGIVWFFGRSYIKKVNSNVYK